MRLDDQQHSASFFFHLKIVFPSDGAHKEAARKKENFLWGGGKRITRDHAKRTRSREKSPDGCGRDTAR